MFFSCNSRLYQDESLLLVLASEETEWTAKLIPDYICYTHQIVTCMLSTNILLRIITKSIYRDSYWKL